MCLSASKGENCISLKIFQSFLHNLDNIFFSLSGTFYSFSHPLWHSASWILSTLVFLNSVLFPQLQETSRLCLHILSLHFNLEIFSSNWAGTTVLGITLFVSLLLRITILRCLLFNGKTFIYLVNFLFIESGKQIYLNYSFMPKIIFT